MDRPSRVSVIIPARNAADFIGRIVEAVIDQRPQDVELEVIVVDDDSRDETVQVARTAGARVIELGSGGDGSNPAAVRNRGAAEAAGDLLVFIDADCTPDTDWLDRLLDAHGRGEVCVGGSLALPSGLSASARCDYYCGWYHVHPWRPAGTVLNHPPCNLSVRRAAFQRTRGFDERQPIAYAHEELGWQSDLRLTGDGVYFEPAARVFHWNRPGWGNLLRRNYRWGYSAIQSKAETGNARGAWLYRHPRVLIAISLPLAPIQAVYIIGCWLRSGILEPLLMFPAVILARFAHAFGMALGGLNWLDRRASSAPGTRPRWE
jgi:glycosyltransferase involved in cell wall biosynthesis